MASQSQPQSQSLLGIKVAVLATDGFEQSELMEPRRALVEAGADIEVISPKAGKVRGWKMKQWGDEVSVDHTLDEANPNDYAALVLPGGVINADALRLQPKAVAFVKAFFDADKPVGVICHAPWALIEAGVARGHRLTSWPSLKTDLENAGAHWVDAEVVVDGQLVTSRKPDDLPAFNREIIRLFAQSRAAGAGAGTGTARAGTAADKARGSQPRPH
ncbi:MAG TPA: type 1 glutamine amidotransferase domain-containing protein [Steroidobacteraceae bacterium]|jgi:protease I